MSDDLKDKLPVLAKQLTMLNSENFREYENRIDKCLNKTITAFEEMVDTGILATDPEQMVNALKVLVTAKKDIANTKRQVIETTMKAVTLDRMCDSEKKPMTAIEKFYAKQELEGNVEDTAKNGMFGDMEK